MTPGTGLGFVWHSAGVRECLSPFTSVLWPVQLAILPIQYFSLSLSPLCQVHIPEPLAVAED